MKRLFIILALLGFLGCSYKQIRQEVIGLSASDVKNADKKYVKVFEADRNALFNKTEKIIKKMHAEITGRDRKEFFISAYGFDKKYANCINTTQAGVLMTRLETGETEIAVASPNSELAKFVSGRLFGELSDKK